MLWIVGVITMVLVLALSLLITRIATVSLTMTGLSREAARFQARSAFTGTGFTSQEAEMVVNHPVRRRIIMALMIIRSAGLVSVVISLILTIGIEGGASRVERLGWLVASMLALLAVVHTRGADRLLNRLVQRALARWTDLESRDYVSLLKLDGPYAVNELHVRDDEWLAGKQLRRCRLTEEGVLVLGLKRQDGSYVGVPRGDTEVDGGDTLILYGREDMLSELDRRRAGSSGDEAHHRAVDEQRRHQAAQDAREASYRQRRESRGDGRGV